MKIKYIFVYIFMTIKLQICRIFFKFIFNNDTFKYSKTVL